MPVIVVIAHNIRSVHNIGSLFRTCEGFGVSELIISGYSSYPTVANDERLPHISEKLTNQIHKTALGTETMVPFRHTVSPPLTELRDAGFTIIGLEQAVGSTLLPAFTPPDKIALLLGEEVTGISDEFLKQCDTLLEIPMKGQKESFNVSVAAGIALYGLSVNT